MNASGSAKAGRSRPIPDTSFTWQRRDAGTLVLTGQQVGVVGGTGGLGRGIAQRLARQGASVVVVGRTFRDQDVPRLRFLQADLARMTEAARIADDLPAEQLDMLIMTTGIFSAPTRQVTAEGLEADMVVSYLSRLVILHRVIDRLGISRTAQARPVRVFIMGFPGTGQEFDFADPNSERSYDAMKVHLGTVAGNEALVVDTAATHPQMRVFGLNPGFAKTNIRANMYTSQRRQAIMESLIGLAAPSATTYATTIVPLLVADDIDAHSGAMFGPKGQPILRSPLMTNAHAADIINASEQLLRHVVPDLGL